MKKQAIFDLPLFALSFRVFFALAGLSALLLIALWRSIYDGSFAPENYYPANYWHAHEMLLGYTVAVISGFLLTAVRNWTGKATITGGGLAALCLLWLYGRITPFYAGMLPDALIALIDFAFLPFLTYQVARPMLQAKYYQGLAFIGLLFLLTLGNALIHDELLGIQENTARAGITLTVGTIIVLILIIAGRVFPFFTERGLSNTLCIRSPLLDGMSVASAAGMFIMDFMSISGTGLAIIAVIAAVINAIRVRNWYISRVWFVPLLWVLYIGYAWIILGFVFTALATLGWIMPTLALHAFTMGGIGVLTLGMMSRVALGHSGRVLKASHAITVGFVLINLAVACRIFLPIVFPAWYVYTIYISIALWLAAFSLFVFDYGPILSQPRIDGKPG